MKLSQNSLEKLAGVKEPLRRLILRAAELATTAKINFEVVQGNRTQAYQNALYAQGRGGRPGKVVTWTKNSKHIGGGAIDFASGVGTKISWDTKLYPPIAKLIKGAAKELGIGIIWGGDWDNKDWGHIQLTGAVSTPTPTPTPTITPTPIVPVPPVALVVTPLILQKGSKGEEVKTLQTLLADRNYYKGVIDKIFGTKTDLAVRAFQKAFQLTVDGKVKVRPEGETWLAIHNVLVVKGSIAPSQSNPDFAIDFFISLGYKDFQAVSPVAHAQQESYKDLRPGAVGDQGTAFGIFQVRGPRKAAEESFAKGLGKTWDNFPTQLLFAAHELDTTEKVVRDLLKLSTNVEEAVAAFMGFLRPAGFDMKKMRSATTWEERIEIAKKGHGWANRLKNAQALLESRRS